MANTILTATVTAVKLGNLEFEGLLLEDGNFGITLQQVASIFQVLPKSAQKFVQSRLGKDSSFFQVKTDREKVEGKRVRTSENTLTLEQFETLLIKLDRDEQNTIAQSLRDSMVGLSLTQLFSDAFNIKFDKDDRQAWLVTRQKGKVTRRGLTDAIKDWYERNPGGTSRPLHAMFSHTTNLIYKALWGMDAEQLEKHLGCGRHESRNFMDEKSLKLLDRAEGNVMDFIDEDNIKPVDAVPLANIRKAKTLPFRK